MSKSKKRIFIGLLIFVFVFLIVPVVLAQDNSEEQTEIAKPQEACNDPSYAQPIPDGIMSGVRKQCVVCGNCDICDFLSLANKIAKIIFGSFGAVAFVVFIYGGISFIIAAGNPERIKKARGILANALIGIVIIVFAWQIIHVVVVLAITPTQTEDGGSQEWNYLIFGQYEWDNPCRNVSTRSEVSTDNQ
ncbi:MAG: pilin [Patescibacteria group bacterium]|jgi:hypothetical protein